MKAVENGWAIGRRIYDKSEIEVRLIVTSHVSFNDITYFKYVTYFANGGYFDDVTYISDIRCHIMMSYF
jgi:hypothetical protein